MTDPENLFPGEHNDIFLRLTPDAAAALVAHLETAVRGYQNADDALCQAGYANLAQHPRHQKKSAYEIKRQLRAAIDPEDVDD